MPGFPQPCRLISFLRIENQYFVWVQNWPTAGQTPADQANRAYYQGDVQRQRTVGGEPAVELIEPGGARHVFVAHDGWMYWLYFPAPSLLSGRRALAEQFDAFVASVRFIPVAPTPTPTASPIPRPPPTPAPTPGAAS